jgi:hypothetical protein
VSAEEQLRDPSQYWNRLAINDQVIPAGKFYPMSGMNLAWDASITNWMYFTLQGSQIMDPTKRWGVDRCGDILAGIISKVMIDQSPYMAVSSGPPYVRHTRASDPKVNRRLESPHKYLPFIFATDLLGSTTWRELCDRVALVATPSDKYCQNLAMAMDEWSELCAEG